MILYTGKGGTGKSVISSATALRCAEAGHETLLLSSDPAHTLRDAFEIPVGDEVTPISKRLSAIQVDSTREIRRNYRVIQDYIAKVFAAKGIDETLAYELALLPGMTNLFSLLRIDEFIDRGEYDAIILDTVASGEALRYLYFPKLLGSVSRKLIELAGSMMGVAKLLQPLTGLPAPDGEVLRKEVELLGRLDKLAKTMTDEETTSIRLVANPDAFSLANAKRSLMTSGLFGINCDLVVMNKVLPPEATDSYFVKWRRLQEGYLRDAEESFRPVPLKKLKLFDTELKGSELLKRAGEMIFEGEDPAKIFYRGRPFRFDRSGGGLSLSIRIPFTEKEMVDVERIGDELVVKVTTEVGDAINILPLPAITYGMKLSRARLIQGELQVRFEESKEKE